MKSYITKFLLIVIDLIVIVISISLAFFLRNELGNNVISTIHNFSLSSYLGFYPLYFIPLAIMFYEGIYSYRYDFWHESRLIAKSLFLSLIIILAYLALTKSIHEHSRVVIVLSFIFMSIFIPAMKNITKKYLYKLKYWQREAVVYSDNIYFEEEIFKNAYLGYIKAEGGNAKTVFVDSKGQEADALQQKIKEEIAKSHEVIFVPLVSNYDLTHSEVYELANTRTNLIVLKNRLKSKSRLFVKKASDTFLFLIAFPLLLPVLVYIAYKIKKSDPHGPILFKQKRMGKDEKTFVCYKFRTMAVDGDTLLQTYLKEHPEEVQNYAKFHKYENDPRITKIGHFLRRTSLDELPQIFNVLKGEMSFIGPRPYMLNEKEKIGKDLSTILTVKPGVTGLWQVSGRSDVDFFERIELDLWYIQNWNLWMDLVILLKTVKTVLVREGAS